MVIRPLTAADFEPVFASFNAAFSDYVVPFQLAREQLFEMLRRRGWVPEASVAAFEDGQVVGFTLNGVEGDRGYDSGTGVIPTHRRRGLARELMLRSIALLRERGCTSYVLEVLEENAKAAELYRSMGFAETRKLQCWRLDLPLRPPEPGGGRSGRRSIEETWWDVAPSWQNSSTSIARAGDEHLVIGDDDGYAVVFPSNGDLPQLAVRPEARRKGIGTRLVREAAEAAGKPLRIMNVDDRNQGLAAFLESVGATRLVRQLEMVLPL